MKKKTTTKKPKARRRPTPAAPSTTIPSSEQLASKRDQSISADASSPVAAGVAQPMTRDRLLTPAQKRGAELVRYLRIHDKKPYGPRGEKAITALAIEVGHLARLELVAREQDSTTPS